MTPKPMTDSFPNQGRIAAIDFGTVRIGIAICDPDRILASPLEMRSGENWQSDEAYYRDLADRERIVGFVVGLPIHLDGGESEKSKLCRQFGRWLFDTTNIPTRMFDERFTTADAQKRFIGAGMTRKKKKQRIDAVAALVLLESFLESCRYHDQIAGQSVIDVPDAGESID